MQNSDIQTTDSLIRLADVLADCICQTVRFLTLWLISSFYSVNAPIKKKQKTKKKKTYIQRTIRYILTDIISLQKAKI